MKNGFVPGVIALALLTGCGQESILTDKADLLSEEQGANLVLHHQYLLLDHDIDYRVVTVSGTPDIDHAANELFEKTGAGSESTQGRGLLLLLDQGAQQVRLEVGYSLEGVFPDAFIAYVEQRQMVPFFAAGRIGDGILASTELIMDRAQRASQNASWEDEIWLEGSGGGGASTTTRAAPGYVTEAPSPGVEALSPSLRSPEDVIGSYLDAMRRRDANPDLEIYTPQTRDMLRDWLVTAAQMDQISRAYASCDQGQTIQNGTGNLAVIRYPIEQRACAPWFLEDRGDGWQLDLTMMQSSIRFGRSNAWRFDLSSDHPYEFAFDDWILDANGFPVESGSSR